VLTPVESQCVLYPGYNFAILATNYIKP